MSFSSISRGKLRWRRSRIGEGPIVGSQFMESASARRPRCEIWHMMAAPRAWMRSENWRRCGMTESSETLICPPPQLDAAGAGEARATGHQPTQDFAAAGATPHGGLDPGAIGTIKTE
jgi:hypothetical protein